MIVHFQLLNNAKVEQSLIEPMNDSQLFVKSDFQPSQLFAELPLPHQDSSVKVNDYFEKEKDSSKIEIDHYVILQKGEQFILLYPFLKIKARDESMIDAQLA